jgi:hypothetical protein
MTHKFFLTFLTYIIIASASVLSARAQSSITEGTEFYFTFTYPTASYNPQLRQIRYVVTEPCYITTQYGDGTYLDNNAPYAPGIYTKDVDSVKCNITGWVGGVSNRILHVTATEKIGVYAVSMGNYETDGSIILPTAIWGKHYTVISNRSTYYNAITVIAPTPGTVFTIRNQAGSAVASRTTDTANPVYNYVVPAPSNREFAPDLSGYTVEANHNVAVFTSCFAGVTERYPTLYYRYDYDAQKIVAYWDPRTEPSAYNYEQLYPTDMAGTSFVLWHLGFPGENKDRLNVVALEDDTRVTCMGSNSIGTNLAVNYLNRNEVFTYELSDTVHQDGATGPVILTSTKPVIVNHIMGRGSTVQWMTPADRRITRAVISPFIDATGSGHITRHKLDVTIPKGTQQDMIIKETRNGVVSTPALTFHTSSTARNYVIAEREYAADDSVTIELINPSRFIAYMTGAGNGALYAPTYIYPAGVGDAGFRNDFTIASNTQPATDTYYLDTEAATHTFASTDNITVKRTVEQPFMLVQWSVNGVSYTETNTDMTATMTFPASVLSCGKNSIIMRVMTPLPFVYTGYVWRGSPGEASDINVSGNTNICLEQATTLTATTATTITNPVFRWYASQTATTEEDALHEGASFETPALTTTTKYYVSVSGDEICENKAGERKEVTVTVAPCTVPVNPHLRVRVN